MALFQQNAHFHVQTTLQISQLATQYDEAAKKLLAQKNCCGTHFEKGS